MFKFLIVILLLLSLAAIATIEAKQSNVKIPDIEVGINRSNMIYMIYNNKLILL